MSVRGPKCTKVFTPKVQPTLKVEKPIVKQTTKPVVKQQTRQLSKPMKGGSKPVNGTEYKCPNVRGPVCYRPSDVVQEDDKPEPKKIRPGDLLRARALEAQYISQRENNYENMLQNIIADLKF